MRFAGIQQIVIVFLLVMCSSVDSSLMDNLSKLKKPTATIEKVDIDSISFRDVNLLFNIGIDNPYPLGIKLDNVKFRFDIENNKLFETSTPKGLSIKARDKTITPFIVNLEYLKIQKIVKNYSKKDYLNCEVTSTVVLHVPKKLAGLKDYLTFTYKHKIKIPALKPVIKIKNFKVNAPSVADISNAIKESGKKNLNAEKVASLFGDLLKGKKVSSDDLVPSDLDVKLDVNFDIEIENKTRAKMFFKDLSYSFFMNGEDIFKGNTKDTVTKGNKMILKVANQLSSKAMGKGVMKVFKDKKGLFGIKGQTFINLPEKIKKEPLKLAIDENGSFDVK